MTIIVTGGSGFIGTNFIQNWIDDTDEKLINIDCLTYAGNSDNLKKYEDNKHYTFYNNRIGDEKNVNQIFLDEKPRAIINFAAESHVDRSILGPEEFFKTNVMETLSLLNVSKNYISNHEIDNKNEFKFIHISTDEVFGSLSAQESPFNEENLYKPNSPYAASKAASDHLVRSYFKTYGLPCIISHCSNNYGPYQYPEKLIPLMIINAMNSIELPVYGKGDQIRDWLHVSDHCEAIKTILERGQVFETYNIGGSNEIRNIDIVKTICYELDVLLPHPEGRSYSDFISFVSDRPGHDKRYAIDSTKIQEKLNWKPKISFKTGIRDTIKWYLENSEWLHKIKNKNFDGWVNKNYNNR